MELKTKRLVLRPVRLGDEAEMHEYAGDPDITMMYWLPNETFEETARFVRQSAAEWQSADQLCYEFVILYGGRIIGGCSADLGHSEDRSYATLGWIINRKYRRQGFATEAVGLMVGYLYGETDIEIITASVMLENAASARVLEKCDFIRTARCVEEDWGYPEPTLVDKFFC